MPLGRLSSAQAQLTAEAARSGGALEAGYLTLNGTVPSLGRLEAFLAAIGRMEDDIFKEREVNEAEFAARRRKWDKRDGKAAGPSEEEERALERARRADFEAAFAATGEALPGAPASDLVRGHKIR